jgi:micrococcal nuclease
VSDGDTIVLARLGKVRLIGIDTPEVHGEAECYGREASRFTKRLLPKGRRVEYRLGVEPRDRYGRALAYVWADGRMVNLLLAERGFAQPLTIPPNVEYAERFVAAARRAREAGRGLWGESGCATGSGDTAGGTRRCSDFAARDEAQRWWEANGRPQGMDGDGDERVCEALP